MVKIKRDLLEYIKPFLKRPEFISIIGPRQSGKTTFLGMLRNFLIENFKIAADLIEIVTFEDRRKLMQFEGDPIAFVESYITQKNGNKKFYLMIDEFQYAVEGGQKLKLIYV